MTAPTVQTLNILCLCLIVPSLLHGLVKQFWNLPMKNGREFFLGVQVEAGFYEGGSSRWLGRYHAMLVTVYLLDFGVLAAILAIGRWDWVPIWAGGTAIFMTSCMLGFSLWARRCVRVASNPPVLSAALSLEPRRLGDYLSWRVEALTLAALAVSWRMLLGAGGHIPWQNMMLVTWIVLGLLPGKIIVVRQGWPIPAEHAEEHRAAQQAARRNSIRWMTAFGAVPTAVLLADSLRYTFPALRTAAAQWLPVAIPLAASIWLLVAIARTNRGLDLGPDLRPPGSWATPFGRTTLWNRAGLAWFCIWFGGVLLLMFLPAD